MRFGLLFPGRTYTDDLVIIADSLEECVRRLLIWKEAMEKKGLRVNAGKTKIMWYRPGPLAELRRIPHALSVVQEYIYIGNNSIYCNGCKLYLV